MSEPYWVPLGAGVGPAGQQGPTGPQGPQGAPGAAAIFPMIPIDLRNPNLAVGAGSAFPNIVTLTAYERWHWEFIATGDAKVWGVFEIPPASTPTVQEIILELTTAAVAGNQRFNVKTKRIADGDSTNPASLVGITAQDIATPATARARKKVTFVQAGETWLAGDIVLVEIHREGAHANDTCTGNTELIYAFARIA